MRRAPLLLLLVFAGLLAPTAAEASAPNDDVGPPIYQVGQRQLGVAPPGFAVTPRQALAVAEHSPAAQRIHRTEHPLQWRIFVWAGSQYEVYFAYHQKLRFDVVVKPDGRLGSVYYGPLIMGIYARGGYGGLFDSPWVLVPFTVLFLLPLLATRRPGLAQLDVAAVLTFGLSYYLFDHAHLEAAVWLAYPPLLYLLARMLRRGWTGRPTARPLASTLPVSLLAGGLLLLIAARVYLAFAAHGVIDVGDASAVGAYKILHGQSIYYNSGQSHGDTYGPVAYLAYTPFVWLWPGHWITLPSVRLATVAFDLVTIAGLFAIGRRLRGGRRGTQLGLTLAWLWAACPFTLFGVIKGTNDGLVAMLLVLAVLCLERPVRRGILLGLAAGAKFSPAVLLPVLMRGTGVEGRRGLKAVPIAFALTALIPFALFLPTGGIQEVWDHTIGFQLTRTDIFSPWALHPGLAPVKVVITVAVLLLTVVLGCFPRGPRTLPQVAALCAALMIAIQLPAVHWFYLYIVWFLPLVLIAVCAGAETRRPADPPAAPEAPATLPEPEPVLVGV